MEQQSLETLEVMEESLYLASFITIYEYLVNCDPHNLMVIMVAIFYNTVAGLLICFGTRKVWFSGMAAMHEGTAFHACLVTSIYKSLCSAIVVQLLFTHLLSSGLYTVMVLAPCRPGTSPYCTQFMIKYFYAC